MNMMALPPKFQQVIWVSLWNSQTILGFPFTHKKLALPHSHLHRTSLLKVHMDPHGSFRQGTI